MGISRKGAIAIGSLTVVVGLGGTAAVACSQPDGACQEEVVTLAKSFKAGYDAFREQLAQPQEEPTKYTEELYYKQWDWERHQFGYMLSGDWWKLDPTVEDDLRRALGRASALKPFMLEEEQRREQFEYAIQPDSFEEMVDSLDSLGIDLEAIEPVDIEEAYGAYVFSDQEYGIWFRRPHHDLYGPHFYLRMEVDLGAFDGLETFLADDYEVDVPIDAEWYYLQTRDNPGIAYKVMLIAENPEVGNFRD